MKYTDTQIGFQEFPDEISLLINISNCPFHCPGCHSPELWKDTGTELTVSEFDKLLKNNSGITCIGFMGGIPKEVNSLASRVRLKYPTLRTGWYYGGTEIPEDINLFNFDYVKIGPYIKDLGGLDNPNTNQVMYHIVDGLMIDITYEFWKNEE
jgi:anaerobic ribonucleoside-triphosphate reductase activating protein